LDQPWKRALEGTVGGFWGLLDEDREVKWPLVGPVSEHPDWRRHAVLAGLLALATVAWGLARGAVLRLPQWLALALIGAVQGTAFVLQWRLVESASKHALEWGFYLALTLASAVAWLSLAARIATPSSAWATAAPSSLEAVRGWLRRPRLAGVDPALALGIAHGVLGVATAVIAVTLVFDPRYRDFPIAIVLPAALALLARRRFAGPAAPEGRPMERSLAWVMLACVPAGLAIEQWVNVEAIAWAVTVALMAWTWLREGRAR
ncbi:MAG: hypothetical protein ACM3O5_00795, partial [Betaproteobacteria bacterium]